MNKFDQVILFNIGTFLDLKDLLHFCMISKRTKRLLSDNDAIWSFKLNKDFSDWELEFSCKGIYFNNISVRKLYILLVGLSIIKRDLKYPFDIYDLYIEKRLTQPDKNINIIPSEINLINLDTLVLNRNMIKSLPKELCDLTYLERLYLDDNKIETLPSKIGKLNNLIVLALSNNKILSLPDEIGDLNKLKYLYLENNQICLIPPEIGKLTNLKVLSLEGNLIYSLPREMMNLKNLIEPPLYEKVPYF